MKLWEKGIEVNKAVEAFTVGNDRGMDLCLAEFDVQGSLAHIQMLKQIGLLMENEHEQLQAGLKEIYSDIKNGKFKLEADVEDIHSQIELLLTRKLGEAGKKIHSGRSRNDQVLTAIKLFIKSELKEIVNLTALLFNQLIELSETHKSRLLPGYTHLQMAMPSSFGLWFAAYAESLIDDLEIVSAAYKIADKSPLGSGAGYGSSFPLDRSLTAELLGFKTLNYNVVYAQMTRGKTEKAAAASLAAIGFTLSKLAMDCCLYMNQNFGFISFPDELTTGSSIMPHKKNPDVWELIRAKCNRLQAIPNELTLLVNNLPSGYHRDFQLTKECLFPAFKELKNILEMSIYMLQNVEVKDDLLKDKKYESLFTVEELNKLVLKGVPFREAYQSVSISVRDGSFEQPDSELSHTHEGSIGNLCNDKIKEEMKKVLRSFTSEK